MKPQRKRRLVHYFNLEFEKIVFSFYKYIQKFQFNSIFRIFSLKHSYQEVWNRMSTFYYILIYQFKINQAVDCSVQLIKPEYMIVCLEDQYHSLAFAPSKMVCLTYSVSKSERLGYLCSATTGNPIRLFTY